MCTIIIRGKPAEHIVTDAGGFLFIGITDSGGKMSGLLLKNVSKIYPGGHQAIKDFSLEVKEREFLILAGPTGCGKSTLLRMIAGLEEISSGSLFIDGKDMTEADPKDRNIAMIFKNSVLYPDMSVADNLSFALRMGKMAPEEIDGRMKETAKLFSLTPVLSKTPEELTPEETYRALLGRALMRRPGILLLDSTIADLEESLQAVVRQEFLNIHKKMDMTVIYVTDNQKTAMTLGTRMVVMNDGSISQEDTPKNLAEKPANCFVASVAGNPPMSFFTASVFGEENRVGLKGKNINIFLSGEKGSALARGAYFGKEIIFGVRANALHLVGDKKEAENGVLTAKFQGMEPFGEDRMIKFMVDELEGVCLSDRIPSCSVGGTIFLSVDDDKVYLFDKETEKAISN